MAESLSRNECPGKEPVDGDVRTWPIASFPGLIEMAAIENYGDSAPNFIA